MLDKTHPYALSLSAGKTVGHVVTLLVASPGILLDKAVAKSKDYELKSYDMPQALVELLLDEHQSAHYKRVSNNVIYKGGFFSKYPLGPVAEAIGFTANAAVSASLCLAVTVGIVAAVGALVSVAAVALSAVLALVIAAALVSSVILAVRSCIVGADNAVNEFKRVLA